VSSSSAADRSSARGLGSGGIWRALSERNYRYYATGSGLSMIGMWTQRLAIGWLTWHLTESGYWLGIIAFSDIAPAVALLPLTGAVADRVDRLKMLRSTQLLSSVFATALAAMSYFDLLTIHWLLIFTLVQGTVTAFNQPVRLALVPNLVKKENMAPAIAIHSMLFNVARFIGPALSAWLIVTDGPSLSLAIPAASYILYSVLLSLVRLVQADDVVLRRPLRDIPSEIFDGFRYSLRHEGIGILLILTLVIGVFGRNYTELLPGFAAQVFGRGADALGMMTSMIGAGAIVAGLWLSNRGRVAGLLKISVIAMAGLITVVAVFSLTHLFWVGLVCLTFAGFCMSTVGISQQILVQAAVDSQMRGRVLGVYGLLSRGGPGIGALIAGALSSHLGLQWPVAGGAAVCLVGWLWLVRRRGAIRASLEDAQTSVGS
jgi:MFS family permease